MLLDQDDEFSYNGKAGSAAVDGTSNGQYFDTTANLAGNTRVKDAGAARDWGAGEHVVPYFALVAGVACVVETSIKVDIVASTTIALTGSAVILSTITILAAALNTTAGAVFQMPALLAGSARRYLGCILTVTTNPTTTARWKCGLMPRGTRAQSYGGSGPL